MRARTDLWEPGASNRLGPPGPRRPVSKKEWCEGVAVKYAWISEHRDSYPVKVMCRVLKVARSGYYTSVGRKPSPRALRTAKIHQAVERVEDFGWQAFALLSLDVHARHLDDAVHELPREFASEVRRGRTRHHIRDAKRGVLALVAQPECAREVSASVD